jgi:hypothetical protein
MVLSLKYCSVYGEARRNYKLIIVQFNVFYNFDGIDSGNDRFNPNFYAISMFVIGKVKVKLSLCLTKQALCYEGICGSGCIDPHFLDLGSSWR